MVTNCYGNSVAGAVGLDVGITARLMSNFESGCAGKTEYADIIHSEMSTKSDHTLAAVMAGTGEDGGHHNTNVDAVVGYAVVVTGV